MAEATCALTPIAYNGVDKKSGKTLFNRAENVHIAGVEFGENPKMLTDSWNCYTNQWLKRCVYTRVPFGNTVAAYAASAFWHGFKCTSSNTAGYYLTFLSASLITSMGRAARRNLRPLFITPGSKLIAWKWLYDLLGRAFSIMFMNYFFIPFMVATFWESLNVWIDIYFVGHFLAIAIIVTLENMQYGQKLQRIFIPKDVKEE
jgi:lysophospholipid acyltransferase